MKQKPSHKQHLIEDLTIWRHKIWGAKIACIPATTFRPNPLVLDDMVIASVCSKGTIYAVDKDKGQQRWRMSLNGLGGASVISAYGLVYGKTPHTLYALDKASGKVRWAFCPYGTKGEYIYSSPTIVKGMLFIGDRIGRFHCLDARTGKKVWCKQLTDKNNKKKRNVNATAVFHNGLIITASNAGFAIALEASTGQQAWKQRLDGPSINKLSVFEGQIFVHTRRSIYFLNPDSGEISSKVSWRKKAIGIAMIAGDKIMVTFMDEEEHSYDYQRMICLREGKVLYELMTSYNSVPWGISGLHWNKKTRLLYASRIGGLSIMNAKNGDILHDIRSKKTMIYPGIVNVQKDIIYVLNMNGTIYAIRHP